MRGTVRSDVPWLPVWFAVIPAAVYVASWTGWFATSYGFDRNGAALNGGHPASTIVAWLQYNKSMLGYGLGLQAYQPYKSNPLGWPVLARPISFYSNCLPAGHCGRVPSSTEQEVLAIGTPLIWWGGTAALLVCLAWWLTRRDWRTGAVLLGVAAGWLPWLWFYWHDHRTEFYYYAVVFDPFLVIAHHAVPRADPGPGPGRAEPPGGRRGGRRRLPARGRRELLLPVSGPRRRRRCRSASWIGPDVVPQLDLTGAGCAGAFFRAR